MPVLLLVLVHKTRFCHFWKSLGGHTNSGPICQLLECASTKRLLCFKCIAVCATGHSGFCKYLTIPLNREYSCASVHFQNVIISSGLFLEWVVYPDRLKRQKIDINAFLYCKYVAFLISTFTTDESGCACVCKLPCSQHRLASDLPGLLGWGLGQCRDSSLKNKDTTHDWTLLLFILTILTHWGA